MQWADVQEEANQTLRETFGEYCTKEINGIEPLKKITLVGAVPEYPQYSFDKHAAATIKAHGSLSDTNLQSIYR